MIWNPAALMGSSTLRFRWHPTRDTFPQRRQPVLPGYDAGIARAAVLDKKKPATGLNDSPHLLKCALRIRDEAEGPCHHNSVDTRIG